MAYVRLGECICPDGIMGWESRFGCFYKLRVPVMGVLIMRTLLIEVYTGVLEFFGNSLLFFDVPQGPCCDLSSLVPWVRAQ